MPTHDSYIVQQLPLTELRRNGIPTGAQPVGELNERDIRELLRAGPPNFAIANVGQPLLWYEGPECFRVWKEELRGRIVPAAAQRFRLEDFPGGHCYIAIEWRHPSGQITVVFAMHH